MESRKKKPNPTRPESGIGTPYILFHRYYLPDLAFFEIEGGCSYFRDPEKFQNELRFPTREKGEGSNAAVFASHAMKFDMPDNLIRRIFPYTNEAASWTQCFQRRIDGGSLRLGDNTRFGKACDPINKTN